MSTTTYTAPVLIQPRRQPALGLLLALAGLLLCLPWLLPLLGLGQAWLRILDFALLYIMLSLGLNIVVGYAGLLDLGYIAFYALGAYIYALLASPQLGLHWPAWVIIPLGGAVACVFGVLLGAPTLRLRGDYLAIVTLGFGEIIRLFMNNLDRPLNLTNGAQGIAQIDPIRVLGQPLNQNLSLGSFTVPYLSLNYYLFLAITALMVLVSFRLQHSRLGRAWIALREDEVAAAAMGINTRNIKLLAFATGASFGGVAGGLFASFQGFVSPESFSLMESVMILCMVVLGGMGHVPGVIVGALLLALTPEVLRDVVNPLQMHLAGRTVIDPENLRMLLFGLSLIVVMRFKPAGLWPSRRRAAEWASTDGAAEHADLSDAERHHD